MKVDKNTAVLVAVPPVVPEAVRPKRKRARAKRVSEDTLTRPLDASQLCAERINALVLRLQARAQTLLASQQAKPDRWDYFAGLADLEARLARLLGP